MGKVALILVALATFTGIFATMSSRQNLFDANEEVADAQHGIVARSAALAGLQTAEQKLADSFTSHSRPNQSFDGARYDVGVTVDDGRAVVLSVGRSETANGEEALFNIRAEYEQFAMPGGIAQEAPEFMDYAVLSEEDLQLQGNILSDVCEICVDGNEEQTLNANMHTNSKLKVTGNSAEVRGFGTHVEGASATPDKALERTFDPYYNPSEANPVHQSPAVEIPFINVVDMANTLIADSTVVGNAVLTGDMDFGGSRENPFILHVEGNFSCGGGAVLDGYVMFIVEGEVSCTGNLDVGDSRYDGPDESSIALYAQGDIELGGNVEIWGQIYTNGDVIFHGTPDIYGTITSRRSVIFTGTVNIFYRVASPALTTYWNGETVQRLRRLSYTEW